MDDWKVIEIEKLKLAYKRQLAFMIGLMVIGLIGLVLYIANLYYFNYSTLMVSVTMVIITVIGMIVTNRKLKGISNKINELKKD